MFSSMNNIEINMAMRFANIKTSQILIFIHYTFIIEDN